MSELKAYRFLGQDEVWPDANLGSDYYLKSEADKVITELKQKINEAQTELELWRDGYIISETHQKELDEKSHSDYKRCLAMARWCERKRIDAADYRIPREKWEFYDKWHRRWLELAQKFKPSNSTAQ